MTKKDTEVVYTYKVVPTGDGRFYTFSKFNPDGSLEETAMQVFNTEADAEKAVRSIIAGTKDVLEVTNMKTVDASDNRNVVFKTEEAPEYTKNGAAIKVVPAAGSAEGDNDFRPVDDKYTPAQKALDEGNVAETDTVSTRPDAEQKAVDAAQAKADKAAAKEAKDTDA